jgi:hypothetical protein
LNVVSKNGDTGRYWMISEQYFKLHNITVVFSKDEADKLGVERNNDFELVGEGEWCDTCDGYVLECLGVNVGRKKFHKSVWVNNTPLVYGLYRFDLARLRGQNLTSDKVAFFVGVNLPSSPFFGKPVELAYLLLKNKNKGKPSVQNVLSIFDEPWYNKLTNNDIGKNIMETLDQVLEGGIVNWKKVIANYDRIASEGKNETAAIMANDRIAALLTRKEERASAKQLEKDVEKQFVEDTNNGEKKSLGYSPGEMYVNDYLDQPIEEEEETENATV